MIVRITMARRDSEWAIMHDEVGTVIRDVPVSGPLRARMGGKLVVYFEATLHRDFFELGDRVEGLSW